MGDQGRLPAVAIESLRMNNVTEHRRIIRLALPLVIMTALGCSDDVMEVEQVEVAVLETNQARSRSASIPRAHR